VKEFKPLAADAAPGTRPEPTELGRGATDFHALFAAASKDRIKHCFVEQEGFDMPPFESLKVDADYMRNLTV
ncbi:MAG: sugar phosphate isomerase/epimerase, partial [Pseudomonadota bacterium]|nr:sugar phosphate isomerase/epimerase [Pseudomonadota bacterium]